MGFLSDNMANATNAAVEKMKAETKAKEAAARAQEQKLQARGTTDEVPPKQ
jgi:hypothetical protein